MREQFLAFINSLTDEQMEDPEALAAGAFLAGSACAMSQLGRAMETGDPGVFCDEVVLLGEDIKRGPEQLARNVIPVNFRMGMCPTD